MFEDQLDIVIKKYPKLYKHFINETTIILKGSIDIVGADGKLWDTYEIEIHPSIEFPYRFPILFECSNKIPKNADWHIFNDGSCCTTVYPNEIYVCKRGITVLTYIEDFVIPYLANQTYRKLTGDFAIGEYSHGYIGALEFYQDIFRTESIYEILRLLKWILHNEKPNRVNDCFCGNKKKFRHCHKETYEKVIIIGKEFVANDINNILQQLKLNYYRF